MDNSPPLPCFVLTILFVGAENSLVPDARSRGIYRGFRGIGPRSNTAASCAFLIFMTSGLGLFYIFQYVFIVDPFLFSDATGHPGPSWSFHEIALKLFKSNCLRSRAGVIFYDWNQNVWLGTM